jgi:hypothetical protein
MSQSSNAVMETAIVIEINSAMETNKTSDKGKGKEKATKTEKLKEKKPATRKKNETNEEGNANTKEKESGERSTKITVKQKLIEEKEECKICCRYFTDDMRKKVTCCYCQKEACSDCMKKYLLSISDDPHCMYCKFPWNREFLDDMFKPFFRMTALRIHRENVLCEREKSRLPETQALLKTVTERMDSLHEDTVQMNKELQRLNKELQGIKLDYKDRMDNIYNVIRQRHVQIGALHRVLRGDTDTVPGDNTLIQDTVYKVSRISMPCPANDCRGFIGNRSYTCDICKTKICKSCHVILNTQNDHDHECKQDDIATVKQLKKEAKNCPGCSALISKIDGCDQMWCTICHTAFSWKSGQKITNGQIHNPHFYEWRRNNGGLAPGAVDMQGCPIGITDLRVMEQNIERIMNKRPARILSEIHREITEIQDIHLNQPEREMTDPNRELRIDYLTGRISTDQWKRGLQKREKQHMRISETKLVFQMYVTTMMDMFRAIATAKDRNELDDIHKQMVSLFRYVNQSLSKIYKRFGSAIEPIYARFSERLNRSPMFLWNTRPFVQQ